jgi:hypothetical protein
MATLKHPQVGDIELERVLYVLSDPVRPGIVRQLDREGEATCNSLNGERPKLRRPAVVSTAHVFPFLS